ncbi:hypothetical protein AXF42_Ash009760 [Apostasia shenzhenica]|uniref:HMA domain-containing protein n=1 Tax=Apostasia shenzhenica TaxID=1088818 RepID=A0A2I0AX37_9ASPA|nr:hypothetical protein AXF42_Ash009760 [Apostasia shenzhenica]
MGKVTVKGIFDAKKMHEVMEKERRKKVECVRMNQEEQICTIIGTIEQETLVEYIHKKARKRGGIIIPQKQLEKKKKKKKKKKTEVQKKEVIREVVTEK